MDSRGLLKFLIFIIVGAVVLFLLGAWTVNYFFGAHISANGHASLEVEADEVSIYINIESRNESADGATKENARIAEDLLENLEEIGFSSEELQLSSYSIQPWREWVNGRSVDKGFIVRRNLLLELDDMELADEIIDASVSAGAIVSSINFALSDDKQSEYKNMALEEASSDARDKAMATAKGQGKSLGRLVSIQSQDYYYRPYLLYESAEGDSAVKAAADARDSLGEVSLRSVEVSASVSVTYKVSLW